jgi:hypothetical protein
MHLTVALLAIFSAGVHSHYTFSSIEVNGVKQGSDWTYFREHTRGYTPTWGNEIAVNDFRCQPGAESGADTDVLTLKGGDTVFMKLGFGKAGIDHPGRSRSAFRLILTLTTRYRPGCSLHVESAWR